MIAMGEGGRSVWLGDENCNRRNRTYVFNFFGGDFCQLIFLHCQFWEFKILKTVWRWCIIANSSILRLRWGETGWWKSAEKIGNVSSILSTLIFVNQFLPSQLQDPQICDIVSSSNIFENLFLIFSSMIFVIQFGPSNSWLWWGEGEWMAKIAVGKNRKLWSRPAFLWCLRTFSRTGWRSQSASFDVIKPLGLSSTPGFLICSTRPLDQATPPIWLGDLQFGRALIPMKMSAISNWNLGACCMLVTYNFHEYK